MTGMRLIGGPRRKLAAQGNRGVPISGSSQLASEVASVMFVSEACVPS